MDKNINNGNLEIRVVDSLCGTGKTSNMIKSLQKSNHNFIYMTPYLNEVDRVVEAIPKAVQPCAVNGKKSEHFENLIANGKSIVTTHSMLEYITPSCLELIRAQGYELIMDEVYNILSPINIQKDDIDIILKEFVNIKEDRSLEWKEEKQNYSGFASNIKHMLEIGDVYLINNTFVVFEFPIRIFDAFCGVTILTYMYDAQIQAQYYKKHGLVVKKYQVCGDGFAPYTDDVHEQEKDKLRGLINIYNGTLNQVSKKDNIFSYSYFEKTPLSALKITVGNNISNFFRNIHKAKSSEVMWTCPINVAKKINTNGYIGKNNSLKPSKNKENFSSGFCSLGARATNNYRNTKYLAYVYNDYHNPIINSFFRNFGIEVTKTHEELYAVSELIQWIFRSRIRCGESIDIYIPSNRMRNLLIKYLEPTQND